MPTPFGSIEHVLRRMCVLAADEAHGQFLGDDHADHAVPCHDALTNGQLTPKLRAAEHFEGVSNVRHHGAKSGVDWTPIPI